MVSSEKHDDFCREKGYNNFRYETRDKNDDDFYCITIASNTENNKKEIFIYKKEFEAWKQMGQSKNGNQLHNTSTKE